MPNLIQFDTTKFDFANEPKNPINPIPGDSVLRWIKQELGDEFEIGEPAPEDWGWYTDVTHADLVYLLGASAEANDDGTHHVMIQTRVERSLKDKLTRAREPYDALAPAIADALHGDPAVANLEFEGSR